MPLKEGKLPTDSEVDVSAASKTDRNTCNKLLCKLGYSRDDDIRYPKLIGQVYSRLRDEEGGNGSMAQERHLYKKLTQCKDNYPTAQEIPTIPLCKVYDSQNNTSSSSSSSYNPPPSHKPPPSYKPPPAPSRKPPPKSEADANAKYLAKNDLTRLTTFMKGSFHRDIIKLQSKLYTLYNLIIRTNTLILNTNDTPLIKKMGVIHRGMASITSISSLIANKIYWDETMNYFDKMRLTYTAFLEKEPKTPKPPKTAKAPKPPKAPKAPKAPKTAKVPKSPKARKGPKTAKAPTPPPKAPTPPPKAPTPPRANSTRKRCPNGTRRNKKTGNCEAK